MRALTEAKRALSGLSVPGKLTKVLCFISSIHIFGHLMPFLAILCHFKPFNDIFGHFMPIFATGNGTKKSCRQKNNPALLIQRKLRTSSTGEVTSIHHFSVSGRTLLEARHKYSIYDRHMRPLISVRSVKNPPLTRLIFVYLV